MKELSDDGIYFEFMILSGACLAEWCQDRVAPITNLS
jgi:hypothetical protein